MVDKAALNDKRISLKAKGILCYLLSKPPDWRPQIDEICAHCSDGETAVRSALQELAKFGYATLVRQKAEGGRWEGSFWMIHEAPVSSEIEVSRIPEKPNLKILRMKKSTNNDKILSDCVPEEKNGWVCPPKESLVSEADRMLKRLLVGFIEEKFLPQWRRRIESSPWRSLEALGMLDCHLAFEKAQIGAGKIGNRGGFANWWYLNCHKSPKELHAHFKK